MPVLVLPFAQAVGTAYGSGTVWPGVVLIKLVEISLILPPLGFNAVTAAAAAGDIAVRQIIAGLGRFLLLDLLVLSSLVLFPRLMAAS